MSAPTYSFVIPVYNEEEVLPELARRLQAVLDALDGESEVILVDDGSTDETLSRIREVRAADPRFKLVSFSRNFGHQTAVTAGLDFAEGDAVIVMDADLQDPPEMAFELVRRWRDGFDVVYAVRDQRAGESRWRTLAIRAFYRVFRRLTDIHAPVDAGDFRLADRKVVDVLCGMREGNRYVRGLFSWAGFRQTGVPYARPSRLHGETKYPLRKLIRLAMDGLVSFSDAPLRLALNLGFVISSFSFVAAVAAVVMKLVGVFPIPGWASLMFVTAFLGGTQLIILGIIGQYLAQIHGEVKHRPIYVVKAVEGVRVVEPYDRVAVPRSARAWDEGGEAERSLR